MNVDMCAGQREGKKNRGKNEKGPDESFLDLIPNLGDVPLVGELFTDAVSPFEAITAPFELNKTGVFQEMNRPLSHYFVSSGHNSYLLGNQLTSKCGPEIIAKSLQRSCRVVELDCYDGNGDKGPICTHGHTLCTPTTFRECIEAVRDNAFVASDFPVVVTIENHCTHKSQEQMADILEELLGSMLHKPTTSQSHDESYLPPPHDLKRKILIRDKIPPEKEEKSPEETRKRRRSLMGGRPASMPSDPEKALAALASEPSTETDPILNDPGKAVGGRRRFSAIVSIENVKLKLEDNDLNRATSSSRPETQLKQLAEKADQVLQYTQTHLIRIYPSASRINSSNFLPNEAWSLGCQVGALNFQSWDLGVQINQGFFMNNGGCGYVRKPEFMLSAVPVDPKTLPPQKRVRVHVMEVINLHSTQGFQDLVMSMFATPHLAVNLSVYGAPQDMFSKTTTSVRATPLCLIDQKFEFEICVPELATLVFSLAHSNWLFSDNVLGNRGVPMDNLPNGSFVLPLHTNECDFPQDVAENERLAIRVAFDVSAV